MSYLFFMCHTFCVYLILTVFQFFFAYVLSLKIQLFSGIVLQKVKNGKLKNCPIEQPKFKIKSYLFKNYEFEILSPPKYKFGVNQWETNISFRKIPNVRSLEKKLPLERENLFILCWKQNMRGTCLARAFIIERTFFTVKTINWKQSTKQRV